MNAIRQDGYGVHLGMTLDLSGYGCVRFFGGCWNVPNVFCRKSDVLINSSSVRSNGVARMLNIEFHLSYIYNSKRLFIGKQPASNEAARTLVED